ncbi:hypothetical protein [Piscicoccus intestinalis]|uniref:hypothetical protein n=1 Tax=Piscicoccus intestinalis TaxID=746033 RepID=UPI0012ECBAF9|nr:hypothetical protein [Piscicoccus intestinalis]
MNNSVMWKSARVVGLAALGVSMAVAPGLSAQSLARSADRTGRAARATASAFGARIDITRSTSA